MQILIYIWILGLSNQLIMINPIIYVFVLYM